MCMGAYKGMGTCLGLYGDTEINWDSVAEIRGYSFSFGTGVLKN